MVMELGHKSVGTTNGHAADGTANGNGRTAPRAGTGPAATVGSGMTARQVATNSISNHRVGSTQDYLAHAGADIYGQYVFGEDAQRQYLAKPIFAKLRRTTAGLEPFDPQIVDAVAHGVKEWALAHGATHYTHWFVPMTGSSREARLVPGADRRLSHDRRVQRQEPRPGRAWTRRPSRVGGIRATFEARGYTAWDVTSPIFLQVEPNGVTLTIPTAYVSFTGEALDFKIPLLRSQDALGKQALRVLRWFGNKDATRVHTAIGPSRSTSSSTGAWPSSGRTCCSRGAPCSARRRPRARSWKTSTSAPSASACSPS